MEAMQRHAKWVFDTLYNEMVWFVYIKHIFYTLRPRHIGTTVCTRHFANASFAISIREYNFIWEYLIWVMIYSIMQYPMFSILLNVKNGEYNIFCNRIFHAISYHIGAIVAINICNSCHHGQLQRYSKISVPLNCHMTAHWNTSWRLKGSPLLLIFWLWVCLIIRRYNWSPRQIIVS